MVQQWEQLKDCIHSRSKIGFEENSLAIGHKDALLHNLHCYRYYQVE